MQRTLLLVQVLDAGRAAEDHHRAVVHGVVEGRAGEHETVDDRHRDARLDLVRQRAQHVVGDGAVQVELVVEAGMDRGNDRRISVDGEPHVAHERLVQDGVDQLHVEGSSLREAAMARAVSRLELHAHNGMGRKCAGRMDFVSRSCA